MDEAQNATFNRCIINYVVSMCCVKIESYLFLKINKFLDAANCNKKGKLGGERVSFVRFSNAHKLICHQADTSQLYSIKACIASLSCKPHAQ
jgi:hypothetical protein